MNDLEKMYLKVYYTSISNAKFSVLLLEKNRGLHYGVLKQMDYFSR